MKLRGGLTSPQLVLGLAGSVGFFLLADHEVDVRVECLPGGGIDGRRRAHPRDLDGNSRLLGSHGTLRSARVEDQSSDRSWLHLNFARARAPCFAVTGMGRRISHEASGRQQDLFEGRTSERIQLASEVAHSPKAKNRALAAPIGRQDRSSSDASQMEIDFPASAREEPRGSPVGTVRHVACPMQPPGQNNAGVRDL